MNEYSAKLSELGKASKEAGKALVNKTSEEINILLIDIANNIKENTSNILKQNDIDIKSAIDNNKPESLIDRLKLTKERIYDIAESVISISKLEEPTDKILSETKRPNGLTIKKISVPIGTLGMIYESRPNVTVDASALCLKSKNTVILRGGSESFHSSKALYEIIKSSLVKNNFHPSCITMIDSTDRNYVTAMLQCNDYIDVIIPRGGKNLINKIISEAKIPVFSHLDGICHTYLDKDINKNMAINITINAKMRRTAICGATETILIHQDIDQEIVSDLLKSLIKANCNILGDSEIININNNAKPANEDDWSTEYLDNIVSIKFVKNTDKAIEHINEYGSHHTDAIITNNKDSASSFLKNVDSANVMHNTSTQFADGGEFGMGAEIGIATGKLHARGPVGVEQLTTYKYMVIGNGQIRE